MRQASRSTRAVRVQIQRVSERAKCRYAGALALPLSLPTFPVATNAATAAWNSCDSWRPVPAGPWLNVPNRCTVYSVAVRTGRNDWTCHTQEFRITRNHSRIFLATCASGVYPGSRRRLFQTLASKGARHDVRRNALLVPGRIRGCRWHVASHCRHSGPGNRRCQVASEFPALAAGFSVDADPSDASRREAKGVPAAKRLQGVCATQPTKGRMLTARVAAAVGTAQISCLLHGGNSVWIAYTRMLLGDMAGPTRLHVSGTIAPYATIWGRICTAASQIPSGKQAHNRSRKILPESNQEPIPRPGREICVNVAVAGGCRHVARGPRSADAAVAALESAIIGVAQIPLGLSVTPLLRRWRNR